MNRRHRLRLAAMAIGATLVASTALAGELKIFTDTSDPAPKQAFQQVITAFEKANPDVKVKWTVFDHEGYKTSIRNFLTADAPDVVTWYAGNRMAPFVKAGLFADVSDVWKKNGLDQQLKSALPSMTIDGKQWGIPYTYYQWGIYYNKDVFKKFGVSVPKTWDEFLADCAKFKAAGVDCTTTGTKALWPAAGWFDYMDLRTNGYKFHMELTSGKIAWTDPRVKKVFTEWAKLIKPGYVTANASALDWQDAAPLMVQGKAATYLIGNFAVATFKQGGMKEANLGFFPFPEVTPGVPRAEDAPTDTIHIPAHAKNIKDAKRFLAFMAKPETQTMVNETLGQLPVNNKSTVGTDPFLKAGFKMLSTAHGLAQFFDRDAPAQMAKIGMEGFQEFMAHPDRVDAILKRLEAARKRIYRN